VAWGAMMSAAVDDQLDRAQARHVLRRTAGMLRPYRWQAVKSILQMVAYTLCLLGGPVIVGIVIDDALPPKHHDLHIVVVGGIAYVVLALLMGVFERAQILSVNTVGESFLRDLRVRVFGHLLSLSMSFFDREQTGRLVSRMTQDIDALEMLVQQGLLIFVSSGLIFTTVMVIMVVESPLLFLLCLITLPWVVRSSVRFRRRSNEAYLTVRERISQTLSSLQESISGVQVIQAFGREDRAMGAFRGHNRAQYDANMRAIKISAFYFPVIEFASYGAAAAVIGVGGLMVHSHWVALGTVATFVLLLSYLIDPIQQISQLFNLVQQSGAALFKLYGLLDTRPTVAERIGAVDLPIHADICLDDVSFSYRPGETESVLENVRLTIPFGQRVALVGPTGAGKSTVAKLIARFYDPTEGNVTYGGTDLRDVTFSSLRARIAVVPQEGFLFSGSILDNVRIGHDGASDQDVRDALALIGALDRFDALLEGLHTEVRERGSRLSAGERQLVSLARVALADPDVLILDEATSNLDPGTERDVELAMAALMAGRTVIVIAHRLSTAQRADQVAMVDGGHLVEAGPHDELIKRGGRYAALYASWAGAAVA
jgi:ATP-binding cassette subfamily B protein